MSLITHKYTPAEMPERELEETFAARAHTLDYLLKVIRDQSQSGTLSSFVITGPRGAGKSTIIRMATLRIRQDPALSAAWIPVLFTEEQFDVASLRDLLAATLRVLSSQGSTLARTWLAKVAAEPDEEQSQQLAITGLGEITRRAGKRLILIVENLDALLERRLNDQMKGTLRRLLMIDPFMMLIGSSVHVFNSLKRYDEAFFNYFGQVQLDRLTADEVFDLLTRRATFDQNERFLRELPQQHAKVRAIVHLSGGNPRLVLMLYELLSQGQVTTIVQYLRRLVDELTPLLKDEMERLPPQQQKIVHALMEKGGTAQPTDLVEATRLPLNAVTSQLRRLKDAQIVEVLGGGKGRAAYYTVPDKLFAIWYQMRYLNQNRRRIELFVEVLRVWFDEGERWQFVRGLSEPNQRGIRPAGDSAAAVEYFAASLRGTQYERTAADLCIEQLAKLDLREAAIVHADFVSAPSHRPVSVEPTSYTKLASWLIDHDSIAEAHEAVSLVLADGSCSVEDRSEALFQRGRIKRLQGNVAGAIADYTAVVSLPGAPVGEVALALGNRGIVKGRQGDAAGEIADYTAVVNLPGAPADLVVQALFNRAITKGQQGDVAGEIADYTAVVDQAGAPVEQIGRALINRGVKKVQHGDATGAVADYTTVTHMPGAPIDYVGWALFNRGLVKGHQGDVVGEIADFTAVVNLPGAPPGQVARALTNRGVARGRQGEVADEIADYTAAIDLPGAPSEEIAPALFFRGLTRGQQGDAAGESADYTAVVGMPGAPVEYVARALISRGINKGRQGDGAGEVADYTAAVELPGAPVNHVARALVNRGDAKGKQGDVTGEIADYTLVVDLPAAPPEQVVRALVNRGIAKRQLGDVTGRIADFTAAMNMPGVTGEAMAIAHFNRALSYLEINEAASADDDLVTVLEMRDSSDRAVISAGHILFTSRWSRNERERALAAVADLAAAMGSMPDRRAKEISVRFLEGLASLEQREAWPTAWRALSGATHGETKQTVDMFRAVCEVLEGADPTILDRLPPEEREFVTSVLQRFEGDEKVK